MARNWFLAIMATATLATACSPASSAPDIQAPPTALFESFTYRGNDPVFDQPLEADEMYNPILAGFYPDPSITQVGGDYYLVNSTFCYFPGIPVFHSTDLVNWTQIGNVIDRPGMLDFDGLGLSRGVFAPTIEYHDGTFYVANTCVDCGGNFIVTASNPAGPWSDPVWVPDVGGIDPSLFFDDDGRLYLMNNDEPPGGSTYDGHRAIWIREIDRETLQPIAEPTVIIDGGARPEDKPIWIEGPHIYKVGDAYLLSAAEGGTAVNHSQVLFKSDNILGPYIPYDGNPVLTQRDLPEDRPHPITSVGHADFVQDGEGNWWAAFLGVRPYQGDDYNTGRETFLLPVTWEDGWPILTRPGETVPYVQKRPALPAQPAPPFPTTGNFSIVEEFDTDSLPPHWMTPRVPTEDWYRLRDGKLELTARPVSLGDMAQPSLLARRQQHTNAEAETEVLFSPTQTGDEAGLTVFQSDDFHYALGVSLNAAGQRVVRLRRKSGADMAADGELVVEVPAIAGTNGAVRLKIAARGNSYDFFQSAPGEDWHPVATGQDGTILSTRAAGGFVGSVFGVYAVSGRAISPLPE